jgi:hypothetical protein
LKIVLGELKDKAEELLTFLEPRVGTKPAVDGGSLTIEDSSVRQGVKPRRVKTYVKRFLYQNGLRKKFRVLVNGGELTVVELEGKEEEEAPVKAKAEVQKPEMKEEPVPEAPSEEPEKPSVEEKEVKEKAGPKPEPPKEKPIRPRAKKTPKKAKEQT